MAVVWTLIDKGKLANQIARLAAIVVKKNYCTSTEVIYIVVIDSFPFFNLGGIQFTTISIFLLYRRFAMQLSRRFKHPFLYR